MPASSEEVAELLGEIDASYIERLVDTGATVEQIGEALDDLDHERRFGERRIPSSAVVAEVRAILEEVARGPDDNVLDDRQVELEEVPIVR